MAMVFESYSTKQGFTELGGCDHVHRVGVGVRVLIWEGIFNSASWNF